MNTDSIRRLLYRFMRFFTLVAALSLIPVAFILSLFLPFTLWVNLALITLPCAVFVSWLINASLRGRLSRKASPFSFYAALLTSVVFLFVTAATLRYIHVRGLSPENLPRFLYRLESVTPAGLLAKPSRKHQLLQDYLRMDLLSSLLPFRDERTVTILNYTVKAPNLPLVKYLFDDIFVHQQYFFATDSRTPFVVDCGSHIGMSVLYTKALYPDAHVLAFEPAPDTFRFLSENIKQNRLRDVTLVNKAVANKEGRMKFYGDDSLSASIFQDRGRRASDAETWVDVVRLSTYIDRPVDFLKIDVEGAEGMVLEDLAAENKLRMVKQMVIEYHHHIDKNADTFSTFLKMLEDNGFGYQIDAGFRPPYRRMQFEDIMIFVYQK